MKLLLFLLAGTGVDQEKKEPSIWDTIAEKLKVEADFRLRGEFDRNRDSQPSRTRVRVRGRLGATYSIFDELSVGARIVTLERGSGIDPNSTHVTLGRGFDTIGFDLDRAYVRYAPSFAPGLWGQAGKFGHPFRVNPVYGELVWDQDVQPEGIALGYSFRDISNVLTSVDLIAAGYVTIEQNTLDDGTAFAAQATANFSWSKHDRSFLSVAYYKWSDVVPDGSTVLFTQNAGNAVAGGVFESGFEILHVLLGSTYEGWGLPVSVGLEYWKNFDAANSEDQGWAAGLAVGKLKDQWDWRVYVQYQRVEQDSVFSPFSQDDVLLQTNFRGFIGGAQLVLYRNVDLHLWVLTASRLRLGTTDTTDDDRDQFRIRLDLNLKL